MSRTDNTTPPRLRAAQGLVYHSVVRMYVSPHQSRVKWQRQLENRRARRAARRVLLLGDEPAPYRHRHSVLWDVL
jgi:hypothetical protein